MIPRPRRAGIRFRTALFAGVLLVAGCVDLGKSGGGVVDRGGFRTDYVAARAALEKGRYRRAIGGYRDLIGRAGPMASRMRIEYAHALLRADRFEDASREARAAAVEVTGLARASALSVQATADHEIARARMARGTYDREVYDRLVAARRIFDEILGDFAELDPQGGLARRQAEVVNAEAAVKGALGI